jgi:hypothetical protein
MTPSIDERLASVLRALSEVILPHLPDHATFAQEQAHLAIGHLGIIRAQLDQAPAYEREELDDAAALGKALSAAIPAGDHTDPSLATLRRALQGSEGDDDVRARCQAIHDAIEDLVRAVGRQGCPDSRRSLSMAILDHEDRRARKDRKWFAPFGFDTA